MAETGGRGGAMYDEVEGGELDDDDDGCCC